MLLCNKTNMQKFWLKILAGVCWRLDTILCRAGGWNTLLYGNKLQMDWVEKIYCLYANEVSQWQSRCWVITAWILRKELCIKMRYLHEACDVCISIFLLWWMSITFFVLIGREMQALAIHVVMWIPSSLIIFRNHGSILMSDGTNADCLLWRKNNKVNIHMFHISIRQYENKLFLILTKVIDLSKQHWDIVNHV